MNSISHWLRGFSTGRNTLLGLIVLIIFMVMVLPKQAAQANENAGGTGTPDLSFMYSLDELYLMAKTYGDDGRSEYVRARFTFDLVWPIVYTFFLVTAISWLFGKTTPAKSIWQRANLVPLLAMVLDYLENISTSIVMVRYPARTAVVDVFATVFTPMKWVLVGVSFILLLIGIAFAIWGWKRN